MTPMDPLSPRPPMSSGNLNETSQGPDEGLPGLLGPDFCQLIGECMAAGIAHQNRVLAKTIADQGQGSEDAVFQVLMGRPSRGEADGAS